MGRYTKYYADVDAYFEGFKKDLYYGKKWHKSYSPSSGNAKIKKKFIRHLCENCSGNEVRLFLMILDSVPETDNPYESGVVKIIEKDWKHVLTGEPFRDAIQLYVELGYLEPTEIGFRYKINPLTWCRIKTSEV